SRGSMRRTLRVLGWEVAEGHLAIMEAVQRAILLASDRALGQLEKIFLRLLEGEAETAAQPLFLDVVNRPLLLRGLPPNAFLAKGANRSVAHFNVAAPAAGVVADHHLERNTGRAQEGRELRAILLFLMFGALLVFLVPGNNDPAFLICETLNAAFLGGDGGGLLHVRAVTNVADSARACTGLADEQVDSALVLFLA